MFTFRKKKKKKNTCPVLFLVKKQNSTLSI